MSDDTKKCPVCAEEIKVEAKLCRFCGATFEVTRRGYCSTDHGMMEVDENGKCKKCGNEVMDIRLETHLIAEGGTAAPAAVPAPTGDTVEWVIEPIRGEGVNWRFNGVFIDAILINLLYIVVGAVITIPIALISAGRVDQDTLMSIYSGMILLLLPVVWFLYFFICEGAFGVTPGKKSSRLKVIRKNGGKISWGQAAIRAFFSLFEDNPIGAIVISVTPLKQRIGDLIAGTLVVNHAKIHKVEFRGKAVTFEFHDYRKVEFAQLTNGVLHKVGLLRILTLNGVSPQGELITLNWNNQFQRGDVDRIRREIERQSGLVISEKIMWWRLIVLVFGVLALLAICVMTILSVIDPSLLR